MDIGYLLELQPPKTTIDFLPPTDFIFPNDRENQKKFLDGKYHKWLGYPELFAWKSSNQPVGVGSLGYKEGCEIRGPRYPKTTDCTYFMNKNGRWYASEWGNGIKASGTPRADRIVDGARVPGRKVSLMGIQERWMQLTGKPYFFY